MHRCKTIEEGEKGDMILANVVVPEIGQEPCEEVLENRLCLSQKIHLKMARRRPDQPRRFQGYRYLFESKPLVVENRNTRTSGVPKIGRTSKLQSVF